MGNLWFGMTQRVETGVHIGNIATRLDLSENVFLCVGENVQNKKFPHWFRIASGS